MEWLAALLLAVFLQYVPALRAFPQIQTDSTFPTFQRNQEVDDFHLNSVNPSEIDEEEDLKLRELGHQLAEILVFPWRKNNLIYIEDNPDDEFMTKYEGVVDEDFKNAPDKKSRYYRKYPWKRQNARQTYDAENRYMCQPNKDDVFRLLVALHEARQGNRGRTVNFCNRKRPANVVFTNIRFLGR